MKIPKKIHDALQTQSGFNKLYIENHVKQKTHAKAYEKTLKDIRRHVPKYKPAHSEESFRSIIWKADDRSIDINEQSLRAFYDLEELFYEFLAKNRHQKTAYDEMMRFIHKDFPLYNPFASYDSFRKHIAREFKKRPKMKDLRARLNREKS